MASPISTYKNHDFFNKISLEDLFQTVALPLPENRRVAEAIQKMSDFYIQNPADPTPWTESWAQIAQLAYYLPLNFLRAQRTLEKALEVNFQMDFDEIFDFGSGLGAGTWPWILNSSIKNFRFHETQSIARKFHENLLDRWAPPGLNFEWSARPRSSKTLGIFSYSITELKSLPPWISELQSLLIIEPSTQSDGRRLMTLRDQLLKMNFHAWTPCTHQGACPLLTQSKTDWCHDRVHVELPRELKNIENHLPFKNRTVTLSYLLMSKTFPTQLQNSARELPEPTSAPARIVGDLLDEKGKSRILICQNSERQYLSWLRRDGKPPELYRGDLIKVPKVWPRIANEIRVLREKK